MDAQRRHSEAQRVGRDPLGPLRVALDCDRARTRLRAQPLDADRSAAGPDVPKQQARPGAQRRQGDRPYRPLGQLPVALVGAVGQPWAASEHPRARLGSALDRHRVQRVGLRLAPGVGARVHDPLGVAAELLHHHEATRAEAALAQHTRHTRRAAGARHVGHDAPGGRQQRHHHLGRRVHGAHELHVGLRPAQARARQREGRGMRMHRHPVGAEPAGQRGADPVEHRIAAREHAHGAVAVVRHQLVHQRVDRRRPGALRCIRVVHQRELACRADDRLRAGDRGAGPVAQARPAVRPDAHDRDHTHSASAATRHAFCSGERAVRRR